MSKKINYRHYKSLRFVSVHFYTYNKDLENLCNTLGYRINLHQGDQDKPVVYVKNTNWESFKNYMEILGYTPIEKPSVEECYEEEV